MKGFKQERVMMSSVFKGHADGCTGIGMKGRKRGQCRNRKLPSFQGVHKALSLTQAGVHLLEMEGNLGGEGRS